MSPPHDLGTKIYFIISDLSNIAAEEYLEVGDYWLQPSLTPGTEAYFDGVVSPIPEQEQELPTDKLLKMKLSQEELRNLCSKETLNTALKMNNHGDLFIVEDSYLQKEKVLTWKIRSESYVSTEIPVYSASRTKQYPVVIRYNEVTIILYNVSINKTSNHLGQN